MITNRLWSIVLTVGVACLADMPETLAQEADERAPTIEERGEKARAALKDAWLDGRLETALLFNEHLSAFDIATKVEGGVVRLEGTVQSEVERDLAGEIAKSIGGVTGVENELKVDPSRARAARDSDASREAQGFRQAVVDATLTARIKSKLIADGNVSGLSVDVDSSKGRVTLSGTVNSEAEKELVASIARNTEGTASVDNRLTVDAEEEAE